MHLRRERPKPNFSPITNQQEDERTCTSPFPPVRVQIYPPPPSSPPSTPLTAAVVHSKENYRVEPDSLLDALVSSVAAECRLSRDERLALTATLHENYVRTVAMVKIALRDRFLHAIIHPVLADALSDCLSNSKYSKAHALKTTSGKEKNPPDPCSSTSVNQQKRTTAVNKPVFELQRMRDWIVSNFTAEETVVVSEATMRHNVCIRDCTNVTVEIPVKVNNISIDKCSNIQVHIQNVVATTEVVHSEHLKLRVTDSCPTIQLDNCNAMTVYFTKNTVETIIVTAKCSEINVIVPDEAGEEVELPIAEQFETRIVDGRAQTTPASVYCKPNGY